MNRILRNKNEVAFFDGKTFSIQLHQAFALKHQHLLCMKNMPVRFDFLFDDDAKTAAKTVAEQVFVIITLSPESRPYCIGVNNGLGIAGMTIKTNQ